MARNPNRNRLHTAPTGGFRHGGKTYREGERIPAKYARELAKRVPREKDQSQEIEGASPNFGRPVLPHVTTFMGRITSPSHAYPGWDEATRDSRENALRMRRDCFVMECIEARQRSVALLNWHIEPENPKNSAQKEAADLLTKILKKTPRFTEYRRNLLEAVWYGRYAVQKRIQSIKVDGKSYKGITHWSPINGDKLAFRFDDGTGEYDENQIGIKVTGAYAAGDIIQGTRKLESTEWGLAYFLAEWERKLITLHQHMIEDASFEDYQSAGSIHGVGIRSRIYWTWIQMQETLAQLMDFIERTGQGIWIYYYPYGSAEGLAKAKAAAFNREQSNTIFMPRMAGDPAMDAFGIDRVDPNPAGMANLKDIHHELFGHRIKRYILGQTLTSEAEATGMGSGVADLHNASYMQIAKYDATNLEETITQDDVRILRDLNCPELSDYDFYFKIDTESADSHQKLEAMQSAWSMGVRLRESDVLDVIGASVPSNDDVVLENPMIRQQEFAWKQQVQQAQMQQAQGNQVQGVDLGGDPGADGQFGDGAGPDGGPAGGGDDLGDLFGPLAQNPQGQGDEGAGSEADQYERDGEPTTYRKPGEAEFATSSTAAKKPAAVGATATAPPTPAASTTPPASKIPSVKTPPIDATPEAPNAPGTAAEGVAPPAISPAPVSSPAANAAGLPAGLSTGKPPAMGEVRQSGGASYRFNEHHRWESAESGEDKSEGDNQASDSAKTESDSDSQVKNSPNSPPLKDRQAFAAKSLAGIHSGAANVIRAMHSSPQFKKGGEYSTHDFAPKQVESLHQEFSSNVGKEFNGGRVVDLGKMYGNGAIGYSSPAGAMVLIPPTNPGKKWTVHYTAMTGPVARSMQGSKTPLVNDAAGASPGGSPGAANSKADLPPPTMASESVMAQQNTQGKPPEKKSIAEKVLGVADKVLGVDKTMAKRKADQAAAVAAENAPPKPDDNPFPPQALGEATVAAEATAPTTAQEPVAPSHIPLPNATASQANPATTADPTNPTTPAGDSDSNTLALSNKTDTPPVDPRPLRAKADEIKSKKNTLLDEWKEKTDSGEATPKVNAEYRSKIAALRSQHATADSEARQVESDFDTHVKERGKEHAVRTKALELQAKIDEDKKVKSTAQAKEEMQRTGKSIDGKDFHEMTREQFAEHLPATKHKQYVSDAISRGVEVPKEVMDQYPELAKRASQKRELDEVRQQRNKQLIQRLTERFANPGANRMTSAQARAKGASDNPNAVNNDDRQFLMARGGMNREQIDSMDPAEAKAQAQKHREEWKATDAANSEKKAAADKERAEAARQNDDEKIRLARHDAIAGMDPNTESLFKSVATRDHGHKMLEQSGLTGSEKNKTAIAKGFADGSIRSADDLTKILGQAKKSSDAAKGLLGTKAADEATHIARAIGQHHEQTNRAQPKQIIAEAAKKANVSHEELGYAIDEVHSERMKAHTDREQEKAEIRKRLNVNSGSLNRMEDNNKDYTHIKGIDTLMHAMGIGHEGGAEGYDDYPIVASAIRGEQDPADALVEILKEGAQRTPARHDESVINEALEFLKQYGSQAEAKPSAPHTPQASGAEREPGDDEGDEGNEGNEPKSANKPHPFWDDEDDSGSKSNSVPFQRTDEPAIGSSRRTAIAILYSRHRHPDLYAI